MNSSTKSIDFLPLPKKFTFSSSENSPCSTPIKTIASSPKGSPSELAKPPVYKRNTHRIQTEINDNPILFNNKSINIREERSNEREIELEQKEKELQNT